MSGIQTFLTPYSHLIFANRNMVIVVLAVVLGWAVVQLLVARWRTERLVRELASARSGQSTSAARPRHLPPQIAEEAPVESGGLPPVKGGRSYARNLGSALQKAGMPAGPQLYSPPVPQGWNPNTGNGQPNPAQPPMQPPTYAPSPAPWGAPPAQANPPWPHPGGANRPPFGAPPAGPPPQPYAQPTQGPMSPHPNQPFPSPYPAAAPGPFPQQFPLSGPDQARPGMPAAASGPWPASAQPAPVAPANPVPAVPEMPADEAGSKDDGRRGKPKRRRFSLSVLDSLEKMVQPKPAEAAPTAATAPISQAAAPAPTPTVPAPAWVETPTLFELSASAPEEPQAEAEAVEAETQPEPTPEPEPEPAFVAPSRPSRPDMRSMLFGEEPEMDAPAKTAAQVPAIEELSAPPVETTSDAETPQASAGWADEEPEPVADVPTQEPEPVEAELAWQPEAAAEAPAEEEAPAAQAVETEAEATVMASADAPDAETPDFVPADPDREATPAGGGAGVLVIIEDDKAAADYYATLFRGNGYQVDIANDGVSGVDLCLRVQPQVILLDVMMPRQNGILVLQTLRASDETRNTPVVVMSNFSEPTLIKRALQLGALEYVIKTQVEGAALLSAIPHWINREKAFAA